MATRRGHRRINIELPEKVHTDLKLGAVSSRESLQSFAAKLIEKAIINNAKRKEL